MQETRYDWLEDRWVLFAPNREARPNEYCQAPYSRHDARSVGKAASSAGTPCPFCAGSEQSTPAPSLVLPLSELEATTILRRDEVEQNIRRVRSRWKVRVVPNKYPAVHSNASCTSHSDVAAHAIAAESYETSEGYDFAQEENLDVAARGETDLLLASPELFRKEVPTGVHEVIIESPEHDNSLSQLSTSHVEMVFQAYKMRLQHFRAQQDICHTVIFKNYGPDAGASLSHAHSQLVGLGFVPSEVKRRSQRLQEYFSQHESCYFCQVAAEEERSGERLILASAHFVVYAPFAGRFPYEFVIQPRMHRSHFDELKRDELKDLAGVVKTTLTALESTQPQLSYNMVLNTGPFSSFHPLAHHWHIQVTPRSARIAGFELGTGCFINTVKPEQAAAILRAAL
ncbi:galactose-1-phosphate uridylyltransferase [Pirellulaceae bacterium SH449]